MAGSFAAVFVALFVAHQVGDHWVQTGHQSDHKGLKGWVGSLACLRHVATYTATTAAFTAAIVPLLDLTWRGFLLGQLTSAVTHYWADRRYTLAWLAILIGKSDFYLLGKPRAETVMVITEADAGVSRVPLDSPSLGTGAYALDQSFHYAWLFLAAVITVTL